MPSTVSIEAKMEQKERVNFVTFAIEKELAISNQKIQLLRVVHTLVCQT